MTARKSNLKTKRPIPRLLVLGVVIGNLLIISLVVTSFLHLRRTFDAKVVSFRVINQGTQMYQPEPGYHFLLINASITQHTNSPIWLTPVIQSFIVDEANHRFTMSPYALDNPFVADVYLPNKVVKGELSYSVPTASKHLKWCYELKGSTSCIQLN